MIMSFRDFGREHLISSEISTFITAYNQLVVLHHHVKYAIEMYWELFQNKFYSWTVGMCFQLNYPFK